MGGVAAVILRLNEGPLMPACRPKPAGPLTIRKSRIRPAVHVLASYSALPSSILDLPVRCSFARWLWYVAVNGAARDPELLSDMRWLDPVRDQLPYGVWIDTSLTALIYAARLGRLDTFHLAFKPQIGFELCKHAKHIEKRLASCGAGVDGLFRRFERDAPALQLMNDILKILHRSREPVDPGNNERVAFAEEVEQHLQLGTPASPGPGLFLGPDRLASGSA